MTQATDTAAPATLIGSEQPLCAAYDVALLDLDGVCFAGEARVPHAADNVNAARKAGMHLSFVTNNASRAPQTVVDKLAANDITAKASEVFSAAMDAAAMLTEHVEPGSTVLVLGGDGVRQALLDEGFQVTSSAQDGPVAVVQGWDPAVDWALLSEGVYAINAGALHVATNLDATLPTERGFALGNGSLVAAVVHASGKEPLAGGKPFPRYLHARPQAGRWDQAPGCRRPAQHRPRRGPGRRDPGPPRPHRCLRRARRHLRAGHRASQLPSHRPAWPD